DIQLDDPPEPESPPRKPFIFRWPQLLGWPLQATADIAVFQVDHLVIHSSSKTLWQIDHLRGRIHCDQGTYTLSELESVAREGTLDGVLKVDLMNSRLTGELRAGLTENIAGVDRIALKFDLGGTDSRALTGQIESMLYAGQKAWFDGTAMVELVDDNLQVTNGSIRFPGHPDHLRVQGSLQLRANLPWQATVQVEGLDLTELAGVPLLLFGEVRGEGDLDEYRGIVDAENRVEGWLKSRLKGAFDGDLDGIALVGLAGEWLEGRVAGDLNIGWLDGFSLRGTAQGRDLDLTGLFPEYSGRVNLDLRAEMLQSGDDPMDMHFSGQLLESTLYGKALTGGADFRFQGDEVDIASLDLHGEGIDLTAVGKLSQRIDFTASAQRLSGLVAGLGGQMNVTGWIHRAGDERAGELKVRGQGLSYGDFSLAGLTVSAGKSAAIDRLILIAEGEGGKAWGRQVDSLSLAMEGRPEDHEGTFEFLTPAGRGRMKLSGGYRERRWSGNLTELRLLQTQFGDWALAKAVKLRIDSRSLQSAPLRLVSSLGETVEMDGVMTLAPLEGVSQLQWRGLRLSHADSWLGGWAASGTSSGDIQLYLRDGDLFDLGAEIKVDGGIARGEHQVEMVEGLANLNWNRQGLTGQAKADFGDMGVLTAQVHSSDPAHLALPSAGDLSVRLAGSSLSSLYPWVPVSLNAEGLLSGVVEGRWENETDIALEGKAEIAGGRLRWQEGDSSLAAELTQASAGWSWRGDRLSGHVVMALENHGRLQGEVQLPLPFRWPLVFATEGAVQGKLSGHLRERGLLTVLFPGSIGETSGLLDFDWTLGGRWAHPELGGVFSLSGASAYLPAAGVQLTDVGFKGRLAADRIFLDSFSLRSGSGRVEGSGEVQLSDWQPNEYQFQLGGKDFQLVNLPELQLTVNPELRLSGDRQQVKLRGSLAIPQALVAARNAPSPVASSPDLIMVDVESVPPPKTLPVTLDARVRILMGDHVLVKANGIDARLGGEVELQADTLDKISAKGKIQVVEGSYSSYGVGLKIERGNVFFAGGPVDQPSLDILALRKAGEVKAGVLVTGTPRHPVAKLYSEPLMPDTDILAYIVLGRPLGSDSGQSSLLMTAAGALLSKGESAVLQDRLKRRLGLDVLEVQAGSGDVASSMVTIGKYLSPKLYVSLGHALFTSTNEFRMRYNLKEHWDLESNVGVESGADLYYRIEFD
ncbi:MAG: hypothetical protein A2X84_07880, partial [Desulfuromonadaceae bacterium GWC2_58_13]